MSLGISVRTLSTNACTRVTVSEGEFRSELSILKYRSMIIYVHSRTVRSSKLAANKAAYAIYGDAVEVIAWNDLVAGQHPEAFEGNAVFVSRTTKHRTLMTLTLPKMLMP